MEHIHEGKQNFATKQWVATFALFLGCLLSVGCDGLPTAQKQQSSTPSLSISGVVVPGGTRVRVKVTLSGPANGMTTADSAGNYMFGSLRSGVYTVTPSLAGATFNPPTQVIKVINSDVQGVNFRASGSSIFSIAGTISPSAGGSGVTVSLGGGSEATTTTDSSGNYRFSGLYAGSYTVTPTRTGVSFNPPSRVVTATGSDITGVNFSSTQSPINIKISGTVSPAAGGAGVKLALGGSLSAVTTTDSLGNYTFSDLPAGSYVVTPSKSGVKFAPSAQRVTAAASNVSGVNFTASASPSSSGPIVITGQTGTVIQGLKISSKTGDCVTITSSTNITIQNSEIGPCAGNGIKISGGSGINVFDNYIHPETQSDGCCDHNDGIFAKNGPSNLWIQGNVIAYGEANIEVSGGTSVKVIGNFLLNPRGPYPRGQNFQCWNSCSTVTVADNYALSSTDLSQFLYAESTEDSISFGRSDSFVVQNNFIAGGRSASGCGIMLDTYTNGGSVLQNRLLDTGQCGIGVTDGSHTVSNNRVYNPTPVIGGGNTAVYVAHYGKSSVCGPITMSNNVADELQASGWHSGWWYRGDCGAIPTASDVFGVPADSQLTPLSTVFTPPLIPPQPKNCVAFSPYSTQTSAAACMQ
jgi:hypothetical protein